MASPARALSPSLPLPWPSSSARTQQPFLSLRTLASLTALHAALGVAASLRPEIATVHGYATLAVGLFLAGQPRHSLRVFYVAAYLATADVFWRMTKAVVPWEYCKYAVVLLCAMIAMRRPVRVGLAQWASLYFLLLLPAVVETIRYMGFTDLLRKELSFNLSGPFALAAIVFLCSGIEGEMPDLGRLLGWMLMPIVSAFAVAFYSTVTASTLIFRNQANFATSGGYGPNQVSAILGLGSFLCLLLALNTTGKSVRFFLLGLGAVLLLQTLLTFSRGGAFNMVVASTLLALHYIRRARARRILLATLIVGGALAFYLVLPRLNEWTSGSFSQRFTNIDTTGRKSLAEADIRLFEDNLLLGAGAGMSKYERTNAFRQGIASHTEFTRLLAEHGLFGLAAFGILVLIGYQAYRLAPTVLAKGWVASLIGWAMAEMAHSAMRIAAISFVFGIATFAFHRAVPLGSTAPAPTPEPPPAPGPRFRRFHPFRPRQVAP